MTNPMKGTYSTESIGFHTLDFILTLLSVWVIHGEEWFVHSLGYTFVEYTMQDVM